MTIKKAFLVQVTPETAQPATMEIPITLPGIIWLLLAQIAGGQENINQICQEVFEAGLSEKLRIAGVGLTPQEALSQNAPGGRA